MKSWKTTLAGALLAGVHSVNIYQTNGGDITDWKLWVLPALVATFGYLTKDAGTH